MRSLRTRPTPFSLHLLDRGEPAGLEVDVLPAEPEDLTAAETEHQDQDQDTGRVEAVSPDGAKEGDRLACVPRRALVLGDLGHVDQEGDVARQQPLTHGPVERVAEDAEHLEAGGRADLLPLQHGHEGTEVGRGEPDQGLLAEVGQQVEPDLGLVLHVRVVLAFRLHDVLKPVVQPLAERPGTGRHRNAVALLVLELAELFVGVVPRVAP